MTNHAAAKKKTPSTGEGVHNSVVTIRFPNAVALVRTPGVITEGDQPPILG